MPRRRILAVCGGPGAGKTSTLMGLSRLLATRGWRLGGVVQLAIGTAADRIGYSLRDVATGEDREFARRHENPVPGEIAFAFDPAGWTWAAERIRRARQEAEILVVEELGRIEAHGAGHLPALEENVAGETAAIWLLGVRDIAVQPIQARIGSFDEILLPAALDAAALEALVACVEAGRFPDPRQIDK